MTDNQRTTSANSKCHMGFNPAGAGQVVPQLAGYARNFALYTKLDVMKLFSSSRMSEPVKHHYVKLIEYSIKNPSFKPQDACQSCGISEKDFRFVATSIYSLNAYQGENVRTNERQEWVLKPEAYFSYLQYLEFRHAIETAKRAFWVSVAAVVLAIISAGLAVKG